MSAVTFFQSGSHGFLWTVVPDSYHTKGKPIPPDFGRSFGIILVSNLIEGILMFALDFTGIALFNDGQ